MADFYYNSSSPLAVSVGETARANKALNDYYLLGDTRSLDKLLAHYKETDKPLVRHVQTLKTWSSKYHWQERVKQYDTKANEAALSLRQETLDKFALQYEDRAMRTVTRLLDKADDILNASLDECNWSLDTAAKLITIADKIARLTTKTETKITQVNVTDIESIKDKLLERIAKEVA